MTKSDSEYRPFQFSIADLLTVMLIVAVLGGLGRLPASGFQLIPLFVVLYLARFRILRLCVRPGVAILLYFIVTVAMLPYLYCCVYDSWTSTDCYVGWWLSSGPIMAFTIPTAFFLYDVIAHKRPSLESYVLRSLLEIVILVPLWAIVVAWIGILVGWVWNF